ncbi:hypothetical protein IAU59_004022 [Kwoniella sp. CBS 9459]
MTPGFINLSVKLPYSVIEIIPWSFPVSSFAFRVAPAAAAADALSSSRLLRRRLSTGCLSQYIREAGFSPGAGMTGELMSEHMRTRKLSFTGLTQTGRLILIVWDISNMKNVTLELEGKSPTVIYDHADIERAAQSCATSIGCHSGQVCIASSKLYVHEKIDERFVGTLAKAMCQF